jgi:hypothetical protein
VPELGEGFGGLDGEAMEIEIVAVVVGGEELVTQCMPMTSASGAEASRK